MGWVVNATPRPLYPRERPDTQCIGGWVDPSSIHSADFKVYKFVSYRIMSIGKFTDF